MFTTPMIQVLAVVLNRDLDLVTEELLGQGVMHFLDVSTVEDRWSDQMHTFNPKVPFSRIAETRKRVETLLGMGGKHHGNAEDRELDLKERRPLDLDEENAKINGISAELEHIDERVNRVRRDISGFEEINRQFRVYDTGLGEDALKDRYSFISMRFGTVQRARGPALKEMLSALPSVLLPISEREDSAQYMLVSMKRDREAVDEALTSSGWEETPLDSETRNMESDVSTDLGQKIEGLKTERIRLEEERAGVLADHAGELFELWRQLRINELFYKIQTYFKRTSRTAVFSGWLPEEARGRFVDTITEKTGGRCYIEWHEPRDIEERGIQPPVQFRNPKILTPFQMLVTNYGIPEYGTIDPTPFVMFTYLVMFGLMFADVGQGIVLALVGFLGVLALGSRKTGLRNLFTLITWCGFSSVVFGALFGSYFGFAWIRPVWFDFHGVVSGHAHGPSLVNDLFDILEISLIFGFFVIGMGLVFNWINLVIRKRWGSLLLDKGGIAGGWIYAGGVYTAFFLVKHGYKKLPGSELLLLLVGIPALLLFFKHPLLLLFRREGGAKLSAFTPITFLMEGIVELLEVFSGYLSNTLSFMRVAGFGIAHVSLMTSFFQLARMASGGGTVGRSLPAMVILVAGNVLVIGLEGLSAGIQSLRLNYYEFFTKFFSGSGKLYAPISLRSRDG